MAEEAEEAAEAGGELRRGAIVVGIDDSEHSFYALQWILGHFFPGGGATSALGAGYKLIIIHSKPNPTSVVSVGGPASDRSPEKRRGMAEEPAEAGGELKRGAIVVGIDDSEHSFYALQWILGHFFAGGGATSALGAGYKLIVIHSKPNPTSVVSIGGPVMNAGAASVLPYIESDLKRIAARVIEKAKELCVANSVSDAVFEVVEGDARNVLCDAVEKFNADVLAVGSHGYGAIKRAVLGSVSDYCAHHAHCTVMIVKKPKPKNKH